MTEQTVAPRAPRERRRRPVPEFSTCTHCGETKPTVPHFKVGRSGSVRGRCRRCFQLWRKAQGLPPTPSGQGVMI